MNEKLYRLIVSICFIIIAISFFNISIKFDDLLDVLSVIANNLNNYG